MRREVVPRQDLFELFKFKFKQFNKILGEQILWIRSTNALIQEIF